MFYVLLMNALQNLTWNISINYLFLTISTWNKNLLETNMQSIWYLYRRDKPCICIFFFFTVFKYLNFFIIRTFILFSNNLQNYFCNGLHCKLYRTEINDYLKIRSSSFNKFIQFVTNSVVWILPFSFSFSENTFTF